MLHSRNIRASMTGRYDGESLAPPQAAGAADRQTKPRVVTDRTLCGATEAAGGIGSTKDGAAGQPQRERLRFIAAL